MMPFSLEGRTALVTGASGRLGPVWVDALIEAGATVVGLDLPSATGRSASASPQLSHIVGDVRDRSSLEEALAQCRATVGEPDILVNNAGIDQPPTKVQSYALEDTPIDAFSEVFAVNVRGAFLSTLVFGGAMASRGSGVVINIGSLYASVSPDPRFYEHIDVSPPFLKPAAYGASKAALVNLTRYFATHWASRGVRVNALSPGGVAGGQDPQFIEKFTARVPLGRMAEADDLVGPLIFLASEASRYVTGVDLIVDGGFSAW